MMSTGVYIHETNGTLTVTGNTYPHRKELRDLGLRWDPIERNWYTSDVTKSRDVEYALGAACVDYDGNSSDEESHPSHHQTKNPGRSGKKSGKGAPSLVSVSLEGYDEEEPRVSYHAATHSNYEKPLKNPNGNQIYHPSRRNRNHHPVFTARQDAPNGRYSPLHNYPTYNPNIPQQPPIIENVYSGPVDVELEVYCPWEETEY